MECKANGLLSEYTSLSSMTVLEDIKINKLFRSKNNPYWNTLVISGYDVNADEPFLGQIDSQVHLSSNNGPLWKLFPM